MLKIFLFIDFLIMLCLNKVIEDVIFFNLVHSDQHEELHWTLGVRESIRNRQIGVQF